MIRGDAGTKAGQHLHSLVELLGELPVLLVTPAVAQIEQTPVEGGHVRVELVVETLQILREATQLFRIDDSSGHGGFSLACLSGPLLAGN